MTRKTSLFVIVCMIVLTALIFSACGSSDGGKDPGSTDVSTAESTDGKEGDAEGAADNAQGPAVELTMAFISWVPQPPDLPIVQDELNKVLKSKINATVKLMPINGGEYQQKTNLMLQSGEKIDLMITGTGLNYHVQAATGQLKPLDELIDNYGQEIKEQVGQVYLDATRAADGKIYAIPTMRSFAGQTGFVMRKDLVDKYGIDVSSIKTLDDLEPVLKTIKDNEPGVAPVIPEAPGAGVYGMRCDVPYDPLGNSLGVLPNYGQDLKVENLFETKEYEAWVKRLRDWYQKGYILRDAATNKETASDLLKSSRGFGHFIGITIGSEMQATISYGMPMIAVGFGEPFANSGYITQIVWAIPTQSESPEKAMEFLNLLYSDPEVVNLIDYGIEGKHYEKVPGFDNVIKFPDDIDPANHPYNFNLAWEFGNQFLSYVMQGNDPDIWEKTRELNSKARYSKALGFVPDVEPVKNEIASVMNVFNQYDLVLGTGSVDPEKYLPEFIAKLKAAGMDKIVAEKQRQLDAWVAKQNK